MAFGNPRGGPGGVHGSGPGSGMGGHPGGGGGARNSGGPGGGAIRSMSGAQRDRAIAAANARGQAGRNAGGGGGFSGRMTGAPGTGVGPGMGAVSMGMMHDASDRTNRGIDALATTALKTFSPINEFALTTDALTNMQRQGKAIPRGAVWGADPIGIAGGLAGGAVLPGLGMMTGPLAGFASRKMGYPGGIISSLGWNRGSDFVNSNSGMSSVAAANARAGMNKTTGTQPNSMNPGLSGGGGFGRSRQGGNAGDNRRTLTVPGYISGLLS